MDENKWGLYGLIFGVIEFNLNLLLYIYFKSEIIILLVISVSFAIVILIILLDNLNRIDSNSKKIEEVIEKLKRTEELNDMRLNIKELQRKVFK